MVRAVTCIFGGAEMGVAEAIELRTTARKNRQAMPIFSCVECGMPVDAHKAGDGSPAHFEHVRRNSACSLGHIAPTRSGASTSRPQAKSTWITTAQLAAKLAGGDDYIRTKDGVVQGLAIRLDLNPQAPEVIVVGDGPRIRARAQLFMNSGRAVPTYVKRGTNAWEYLGEYRATAFRKDAQTIRRFSETRVVASVAGILFLECIDKVSVGVGGGGFGDPLTRKEVEEAAVRVVTAELNKKGFVVEDRQRENCGYDLLAISPKEILKVEVKGTDSEIPRFFITRNERASAAVDPEWRLAIVTAARRAPVIHFLTAPEAEKLFLFDALAWECTLAIDGGIAEKKP